MVIGMFQAKLCGDHSAQYIKVYIQSNQYIVGKRYQKYSDVLLDEFKKHASILIKGEEPIVMVPKKVKAPIKKTKQFNLV